MGEHTEEYEASALKRMKELADEGQPVFHVPPLRKKFRNDDGRPKGAKNKVTADVKAAFLYAFEKSGGAKALAEYAEKEQNRTAFYTLLARMIPQESKVQQETKISGSITTEAAEKFDDWLTSKPKPKEDNSIAAAAVVASSPPPEGNA